MPTDIAGAVEPDYTAAIPVPLDGEYANSTALQNMVLPLANRIEYVRGIVQDQPWIRGGFFDDFGTDFRVIDASNLTYQADTPWFASADPATNGFGQVLNVGDSTGVGVVRHRNSGGGAAAHVWRKSLALLGSVASVRRFVVRVRANSIASGMRCDIGVSGSGSTPSGATGDNSMCFHFNPATSANWMLRTDDFTNSTFQASGVPVVAGTWYTLECVYTGSLASFYIDGVFQFSTSTTLPLTGLNTTFKIGLQTPNSGASREWLLDYVMLDCDFSGRSV